MTCLIMSSILVKEGTTTTTKVEAEHLTSKIASNTKLAMLIEHSALTMDRLNQEIALSRDKQSDNSAPRTIKS